MLRFAARAGFLIFAIALPEFARGQAVSSKPPIDLPILQSDPAPDGAVHRFGTTRLRLPNRAGYFLFNPDDSVVMVGSGADVRFWETKTWREIWRLDAFAFSASPDGKHVARQTFEHTIEIWNVDKKARTHVVPQNKLGRNERVFDIEYNSKGDLWLAISGQGLWLYDWNKGEVIKRINANDILDGSLCISRDRKVLAFRRHTERISIYDATTGDSIRAINNIRTPGGELLCLSHDGKILAGNNHLGEARFWDTKTGKNLSLLPETPKKSKPSDERDNDIGDDQPFHGNLLFDAKGEKLVFTGSLSVVDIKSKKLITKGPADFATGFTGAISNSNEFIIISRDDCSVDVRRLDTLKPMIDDPFPRGAAISVAFSHDGKTLATLNDAGEGEARTWRLSDFSLRKQMIAENAPPQPKMVVPGGGALGGGFSNFITEAGPWAKLAFLPGDRQLAYGSGVVWDVNTGAKVKSTTTEHRFISATANSSRWLIAKANEKAETSELTIFDPKLKKDVVKLPLEISADTTYHSFDLRGAFSVDGGIVALQARPSSPRDPNTGEAPFREGSFIVWNVREKQPIKLFSMAYEQAPRSFDLAPDGRFVAMQGAPSTALPHRMWHVASGLPLWKLEKDELAKKPNRLSMQPMMPDIDFVDEYYPDVDDWLPGFHVAFSPDGQFIAEAGEAGIAIRETLSGARLMTFPAPDGDICELAFSPDGRLLASGSRHSTVTLWAVPPFAAAPKGEWKGERFESQWNSLKGEGLAAFKAMADLHAGGDDAVAAMAKLVRKEIVGEREQILEAIKDLGSPKFLVREKATTRLERWGYKLKPFLVEAIAEANDLEQKRRLIALYDRYKAGSIDPNEMRLGRCVYVLERIGTPAARALLEEIGRGDRGDMVAESARVALARMR